MENNENTTPQVTFVFDQKAKDEMATIVEEGGGSGGSSVIANPTLAGDEAALTGLEVDGTKYKVDSGGGELPVATDETIGGIKIGGQGAEFSTTYLPVELDGNNAAYVDTSYVNIGTADINAAYINEIAPSGSNVNIGSIHEEDEGGYVESNITIGSMNNAPVQRVSTNTIIKGDVTIGQAYVNNCSQINIGSHNLDAGTVTTTYFHGNVNFSSATNLSGVIANNGIPAGGIQGDVLIKASGSDYVASWQSLPLYVNYISYTNNILHWEYSDGGEQNEKISSGYIIINKTSPLTEFIPLMENLRTLADTSPGTQVGFSGCNVVQGYYLVSTVLSREGSQVAVLVAMNQSSELSLFVSDSLAINGLAVDNGMIFNAVIRFHTIYSPVGSADSYDYVYIQKGNGDFKLFCTKHPAVTALPNQDYPIDEVIPDMISALETLTYEQMENLVNGDSGSVDVVGTLATYSFESWSGSGTISASYEGVRWVFEVTFDGENYSIFFEEIFD